MKSLIFYTGLLYKPNSGLVMHSDYDYDYDAVSASLNIRNICLMVQITRNSLKCPMFYTGLLYKPGSGLAMRVNCDLRLQQCRPG